MKKRFASKLREKYFATQDGGREKYIGYVCPIPQITIYNTKCSQFSTLNKILWVDYN